jgi:PAS domain S-box-containing protein
MHFQFAQKWLDLRIASKVGLVLTILVCACLVVAGSAFVQSGQITARLNDVVSTLLPATRQSQKALGNFTEQLRFYEDAVITDEDLLLDNATDKANRVDNSLAQLEQLLQGSIQSDTLGIPVLTGDIAAFTVRATAVYGELIESVENGDHDALYDEAYVLAQQALSLKGRLIALNMRFQDSWDDCLAGIRKYTEKQRALGGLLALLTIGLGLLISFLLTRLITRPIVALADTARSITEGSWSGELTPVGNDEVAELTRSLKNMLIALRQRKAALVESEKRYREIFNATREAIIIYDAATQNVLDCNRTCCNITGFTRDEVRTMHFSGMGSGLNQYTTKRAQKFFKKTLEGKPQVFEWQVRKKSGELGMAELSLTLSENEKGRIVIMVARDITRKKKNEAEREELAKQLQQTDKMETLGTLAGGIAHDFNNILSGIFGYTELASMHNSAGKDVETDLAQIKKAAFRARDLVSQILAFSRKGAQAVSVFDPGTVVKEVVTLLRSTVPSTIEIQHVIKSDARIKADPSQFHQVMMNLCTNAVHAMEEHGGTLGITVSEMCTDDPGVTYPSDMKSGFYLCLKVSDTGVGMNEDTRRRIFEPYFTTKNVGKGTGLGLSVVHGIVTEYGGQLVVESEPGRGTTFWIYLPLAEPEKISAEPIATANMDGEKTRVIPGGGRIMLVDDELDLVNVTAAFLVQAGYQVSTYTDSVQAFQDFTKTPKRYSLVITDMTMPGMTGLELSQKLLLLCPSLPIILLTGYSEQVTREEALSMGIREFMQKPIELQGLLQVIHKIL